LSAALRAAGFVFEIAVSAVSIVLIGYLKLRLARIGPRGVL
jgi:hypothetical protein